MTGNKTKELVRNSLSLKLINGGPNKVQGVGKNKKLIHGGHLLGT